MEQFIRIGVDLGKRYFQVHALASADGRAVTRKLARAKFLAFFADVAPCLIGMEACSSAHYWARQLRAMGHDVRLMPPSYVKAYVKRGKNDAVDAAACCEAVSRPDMRFVPIKNEEQQSALMLHRTRELLVRQRTMSVNALRGLLAEFGFIVAKGVGRASELIEMARNDVNLPEGAKAVVEIFAGQLETISAAIRAVAKVIANAHARNPMSQLLAGIPGVGKVIASAIVSTVPDSMVFKSARDFSAWLGLVPRQDSTGGKAKLGAITKKGDRYIRKLLVLGATSLLRVAGKRKGALKDWLVALLEKKSARLASVALANKLARIIWGMMSSGETFRKELFEPA
jgi:transposase